MSFKTGPGPADLLVDLWADHLPQAVCCHGESLGNNIHSYPSCCCCFFWLAVQQNEIELFSFRDKQNIWNCLCVYVQGDMGVWSHNLTEPLDSSSQITASKEEVEHSKKFYIHLRQVPVQNSYIHAFLHIRWKNDKNDPERLLGRTESWNIHTFHYDPLIKLKECWEKCEISNIFYNFAVDLLKGVSSNTFQIMRNCCKAQINCSNLFQKCFLHL